MAADRPKKVLESEEATEEGLKLLAVGSLLALAGYAGYQVYDQWGDVIKKFFQDLLRDAKKAEKDAEDAYDELAGYLSGQPEEKLKALEAISPEAVQWGLCMGVMWDDGVASIRYERVADRAKIASAKWGYPVEWIKSIGKGVPPEEAKIQKECTRIISGSRFISPYRARRNKYATMVPEKDEYAPETVWDTYVRAVAFASGTHYSEEKLNDALAYIDADIKELSSLSRERHPSYVFTLADRIFGMVEDIGYIASMIWQSRTPDEMLSWNSSKGKGLIYSKVRGAQLDYTSRARDAGVEVISPPYPDKNCLLTDTSETSYLQGTGIPLPDTPSKLYQPGDTPGQLW